MAPFWTFSQDIACQAHHVIITYWKLDLVVYAGIGVMNSFGPVFFGLNNLRAKQSMLESL